MANNKNTSLPNLRDTLVEKVFPRRIATHNRLQSACDESLVFPVSAILSHAVSKGDFNKKKYLTKVAGNVTIWYRCVDDLDNATLEALDYDKLRTTTFYEIKEITMLPVSDDGRTHHLAIKLDNGGYGIVYNPPVLTHTLREIALAQGTYTYKCAPISIKDLRELQLDHEVPLAAWLSSNNGGPEYKRLEKVCQKFDSGADDSEVCQACLEYLKFI